jgi:hypothetical protein
MGAVHGQAYGDATEGPEQGAHDHQKLAATASDRATGSPMSNIPPTLPDPMRPNLGT